jgi:hypothetical protein
MSAPHSALQQAHDRARRFPPPWSVEESDDYFIVKDSAGQKLAYVYFEDEGGEVGLKRP